MNFRKGDMNNLNQDQQYRQTFEKEFSTVR